MEPGRRHAFEASLALRGVTLAVLMEVWGRI
jgi:hypothetical protein